jgi:hypothetical protein
MLFYFDLDGILAFKNWRVIAHVDDHPFLQVRRRDKPSAINEVSIRSPALHGLVALGAFILGPVSPPGGVHCPATSAAQIHPSWRVPITESVLP